MNEDMYQAICAIANELFIMLNRPSMTPTKMDHTKPIAMSPSDLRYWLKMNKHPDFKSISALLNDCDNQMDIRHHATHYGAVPVYADAKTGILYTQKNFKIGELLTKYDILRHMKSGKPMINLVEASRPRLKSLCVFINRIFKYIYRTDAFEKYMADTGIKIVDSYKPYWEIPE